jgi:type II secretory pathway component PulF
MIGGFTANYFIENGYECLGYPAALISVAGCIGIIARNMVVPKPTK